MNESGQVVADDLTMRVKQAQKRADELDDDAYDDRATRAVLATEAMHPTRDLAFVEALEFAVEDVARIYRAEQVASRSLFDTWRLALPQMEGTR